MKATQTVTMMALTALMLCSACGQQTTQTATFVTPTSQQVAVLKWDEAIAASTTVKVNNSNLIAMR